MPTGDISQIKPDLQIKACEFVLDIKESDEFESVLKARALVSEDTWRDYELHEFQGLQEQNIYNAALQDLQKLWGKNRPNYWGRHYPDPAESYLEED